MDVRIARKWDYYLGIPLCWVFSMFHMVKFWKRPLNKRKNIYPRKVLFIELCEMGSIILGYSAIREVKSSYSNAEIYFLTFRENAEAVILSGDINKENIIGIRSENTIVLLFDLWRTINKLRKIGIDTIIDMNLFFRVTTIISYLTKASIRVGFYQTEHKGLYRGDMQTHNVLYDPDKHIKDNFLLLVKALNSDNFDYCNSEQNLSEIKKNTVMSSLEPQDMVEIKKRLSVLAPKLDLSCKIILMNLGQRDAIGTRKWPVENYNNLISMLLADEHTFILMIGKDHPGKEKLFKHAHCLDLIDKTSFRDIIHLCKIADAIVSHDCGLIHIASLTNIFICVLFGPETPKLYAPISDNMKIFYKGLSCSPCVSAFNNKLCSCLDNKCLSMISTEEVYDCLVKPVYKVTSDTNKIDYKL